MISVWEVVLDVSFVIAEAVELDFPSDSDFGVESAVNDAFPGCLEGVDPELVIEVCVAKTVPDADFDADVPALPDAVEVFVSELGPLEDVELALPLFPKALDDFVPDVEALEVDDPAFPALLDSVVCFACEPFLVLEIEPDFPDETWEEFFAPLPDWVDDFVPDGDDFPFPAFPDDGDDHGVEKNASLNDGADEGILVFHTCGVVFVHVFSDPFVFPIMVAVILSAESPHRIRVAGSKTCKS